MTPVQALSHCRLTQGLDAAVLQRLAQAGHLLDLPEAALVLDFDDPSSDVFFVLRGAARVVVRTAAGREIIFSDLEEGDQFGEIAAIDGGARSASVATLRPSLLLAVPATDFRVAAAASPAMTERLLLSLAGRVRTLSARFVEVALGTVRHRLVAELMRLSRPRPDSDARVISPPVRHHILAARIGVRREAVTRELAALERAGLVRQEPAAIVLLRPLLLRDLTDEP